MPKKPNLKTNYENVDPDYSPSGSPKQTPTTPSSEDSTEDEIFTSPIEISSDESNKMVDHTTTPTNTNTNTNKNPFLGQSTAMDKQEIEEITKAICKSVITSTLAAKQTTPKVDLPKLNMNNYVDWVRKIRSALKFNNLWIDPLKDKTKLTADEIVINRKAAFYLALHLDDKNASFVNDSNEECFLSIWASIDKFHQPRTATILTDIHCKIQELKHVPGSPIEDHLLNLEAQFTRFEDVKFPLDEKHKVALILASVKSSPDFKNVFHSALWEDDKTLSIAKVKSVLITTHRRLYNDDQAHVADLKSKGQSYASQTKFKKFVNRKRRNY